jgi:GT2 family glycosyltransferase
MTNADLKNIKFGAFVITYERSSSLLQYLADLFSQKYPPEIVLVVDNSSDFQTRDLVMSMGDGRVVYHRVGFNSGPAGASLIGLEFFLQKGFAWIYWGDDDDPPEFGDEFKELLKLAEDPANKDVGILGVVGHKFNRLSGEIIRTKDNDLEFNSVLEVDSVAGNQCMLVNGEMVRKGILPDPDLFFGFEELDFCLRARKAGYRILVPTRLFARARAHHGRSDLRKTVYNRKDLSRIRREYYSTRNLLVILRKNHLWPAFGYQSIKALLKMIYGFRYGLQYGKVNFTMVGIGLWDGICNLQGRKF